MLNMVNRTTGLTGNLNWPPFPATICFNTIFPNMPTSICLLPLSQFHNPLKAIFMSYYHLILLSLHEFPSFDVFLSVRNTDSAPSWSYKLTYGWGSLAITLSKLLTCDLSI
ncbi:Uncharacterized protein TCM_000493 [Theobroma cacao]|uniref:Uncharacterized protein n=1 Tax=Theobroma cacao TaxID=3641 RepID=A0A061DG40_THECC|nr:Uncharacterized protein TCM_000493 [Theobroma cacao]